MDAMKYMRWKDALNINNKNLDEVVRDSKKINSGYKTYLDDNPYKEKRKELMKRKERLINRIIELTKQGVEKYDGK